MFGKEKKEEIMKEYYDGTKRINIDYKNIKEYNEPFVMTLKVKGKNKYDVWQVSNGREAETIRERYKRIGRRTSYGDFYRNIKDLLEEKQSNELQLKPRIRGNNKNNIEEQKDDTKIDLGELYHLLGSSLKTHSDIEEYVRNLVKEDLEEMVGNLLDKIKSL
jgi:hypothetical protein